MKKRKIRIIVRIVIVCLIFLGIFIFSRVMEYKENPLKVPLGDIVSVNGHNISIYTEGEGPKTLVFMAGGGTCSPILDFKALYTKLSDSYRIVVVEKLGYGFSDSVNCHRDIDSILNDTRGALKQAGITGPFILCPHSMSGIEAIYWAQEYPKEVEGIIGLDMATPYHYENMRVGTAMLYLSKFFLEAGFVRLIPNIWKGDAVKQGILSDKEQDIYKAVFFEKTLSVPMLKEASAVKKNAEYVAHRGLPQIPLLMFISNGKGTGMKDYVWRDCSGTFVDNVQNGEIINLDCPHYIHDYQPDFISEEIKVFLGTL